MVEISEPQEIRAERDAERAAKFPAAIGTDGKPLEPIPHPDSLPTTASPKVDHKGILARLSNFLNRRKKTAAPENSISQAAIDIKGNALHGIGNELTEEELRKLEGSKTEESLPPLAQKAVDKFIDKYPPVVEPEDEYNQHDADSGLDEIGTRDKIVSPPFQQGTVDNVTSINENVVVPPQNNDSRS